MGNSRYQSGRRAEWELKKEFEALGHTVVRAAGSKGKIDLVVLDDSGDGITTLIQVKSTKDRSGTEAKRLWSDFQRHPPTRPCYHFRRQLWVKEARTGWRSFSLE